MKPEKFVLLKDIVIKAGTEFECVDGDSSKFVEGNYAATVGLTSGSSGRVIYGIDDGDFELGNWFVKVPCAPSLPDSFQEAYGVMSYITMLKVSSVERNDFATLDAVLGGVDVARSSKLKLVGFLRASYSVRDKLVNWDILMEQVRDELQRRGEAVESLMQGLLT